MSYAQAIFPDRWRCAGIQLAPHTLGHALLLQRLGNPYAGRPGNLPSALARGSLAQALFVCSRGWDSALRLIDTRRERLWLYWRTLAIRRRGLPESVLDLHAYLSAAWPVINYWKANTVRTRELGADLLQIYVDHQRRMGLTLNQALDVPMAVAIWDHAAWAEREGTITLHGAADEEIFAAYERMEKEGRFARGADLNLGN